MPTYVILRQHTSSEAFEDVKAALRLEHHWLDQDGGMDEWVALPKGNVGPENFSRAAVFLTRALEQDPHVIALVDEVDALHLNPLASYGWASLIAMLILAFPEVRWHFLLLTNRPKENANDKPTEQLCRWEDFEVRHGISALYQNQGTPLFDGYGLRQHVLWCMAAGTVANSGKPVDAQHVASSVPTRCKTATALDEEKNYAWLEAYMAYSRGFRAHAIASWTEAVALLGPKGLLTDVGSSNDYALSIEDWFLNYSDRPSLPLSNLDDRSRALPVLNGARPPVRRFITVGHEKQTQRAEARAVQLLDLRLQERLVFGRQVTKQEQIVYKPASGLYTLWCQMGLHRAFRNEDESAKHLGLAPGFVWPPQPPDKTQRLVLGGDPEAGSGDGHSSPGRLLQIAEQLLQRASALVDDVNTLTEAVRGAILATQALELLGCKTPTASEEALVIKHTFEIVAECQFVGVEYHLSMDERMVDVRCNLEAMSRWLHHSRCAEFMLNAEAMVLRSLIAKLDDYGEYEESQICQCRLRTLHRKIGFLKDKRERNLVRLLLAPFNLYADCVLRSPRNFAGAILVTLLLFTAAFRVFGPSTWLGAMDASIQAMLTFDSADPRCLSYLAAASALVNFGLLVTLLYERTVRK